MWSYRDLEGFFFITIVAQGMAFAVSMIMIIISFKIINKYSNAATINPYVCWEGFILIYVICCIILYVVWKKTLGEMYE